MGNNGDDAVYEDDDERVAKQYGSLSPIASAGGDPDAPLDRSNADVRDRPQDYDSRNAQPTAPAKIVPLTQRTGQVQLPNGGQVSTISGTGSNDPEYKPPPKPTNTAPVNDAPPNNPPRSWQDYYAKAGLEGQLRNTVEAENTAQYVANLPDESATVRPLEAQRATIAAQTPDPNADQYKPSVGQRIFRGIQAGVTGLARGGVLGAAAGAINADYKAPNRQYSIDAAKNAKQLGAADQQISVAQKAYEDATARAKANAAEQKATADEYGKLVTGATGQETEQNKATQDAETARHNAIDEAQKGVQNANTAANEKGNLAARNREVNIQGGRLSLEKSKEEFEEANGNTPSGNPEVRQQMIDDAAGKKAEFENNWSLNKDTGMYQDTEAKNFMKPNEYVAKLNQFGADLDLKLASKKQPTLGLRYKLDPKGGYPVAVQQPPPQAPGSPSSSGPKARPAKGSTITVDGKPHQVVGFNEKTGKVIVAR